MMQRMRIWIKHLQAFVDRWWYFPLLGLLAGLDLFILVVPTDALLVSSVMLRPKKWIGAFIWVGLGSAMGALALSGAIQWDPDLVMRRLFPNAFNTDLWRWMDAFFDRHGHIALCLIAASPLVQFPAIILAALSGMPLTEIFFVSLLGRWAKSAAFSYGASHAPKLLLKLPFMQKELEILELPESGPNPS